MSELSANLSLPFLAPAQAQKHVTHNEALTLLDAVVQLAVLSRSMAAPPAAPETGARYILPAGASGGWAGLEAGALALWDGTAWRVFGPGAGWRVFVLDEAVELVWRGGDWQAMPLPPQGQTGLLGVNAAPDMTNRLSVAAAASLLSHEGAGHQLKINKAAAGDTGSLLFQTGWSGRAEMGCAGSDEFSVKVSEDGASWRTALSFEAASGRAHAPQGVRVDGTLSGSGVLGTVAQLAGESTGALLETGEGAGGAYLRLADGTQICWHTLTSSAAGAVSWSYPADFAAPPVVTGNCASGGAHLLSAGSVAAGSAGISAWDLTGARVAVGSAVMAVGRWV
ncbi:DUF2793 domain-containing protein [Salipiger sp. PrR002]|uniref:DUF2793 domain-containing protein n=1 Tax=Salipiger sp. PrR002 TaxID=2706489 RepID=UPI0013B8A79A|nr:DUF2793 domain-containing protein [Salipiger sp. PrR002]NDW01323.1 DUF2793 domain-containing protein [Salipiger sp. PrR002]NDW58888.1 DUF2793 domain-containing protein [Salipiger sp. PrR004]